MLPKNTIIYLIENKVNRVKKLMAINLNYSHYLQIISAKIFSSNNFLKITVICVH